MASFNKVILIGNMTADPELKQTTGGTSVCSFSIAVNRRFAKADQGQQNVDFINIVTWRQQAEFISKFFRRGPMIAIQGNIQTRTYEDPNGNKRKAVEIVVDNASFCGSKSESGTVGRVDNVMNAQPAPSYSTADEGDFKEIPEDDLPF